MAHLTDRELLEMVSGALPESARETAEAHARQCAQCRARLTELGETWELLGKWQLPAHTPDLSGRIVSKATSGAASGRRPQLIGRGLAKAAAAVLMAAAVGYGLGRAFGPDPQAGPSRGPGRTGEDNAVRALDLQVLGSSPVGLADSLAGLHTDSREIPQ